MRHVPLLLTAAVALLASIAPAGAQPSLPAAAPSPVAATETPTARPRVALVLSGGGARGLAHLGVLRVLQQLRVPVDVVVGTSMGAVVGGAFAAGRPVEELERQARGIDWLTVLADRPPRGELSPRRREDDLLVPSRIEFGIGAGGITLPPAAAGNQVLESTLRALLPRGAGERAALAQPLPFVAVATDLLTGEMVRFDDEPLFDAVRASLSVPGLFAPVRVGGRLVVDGGLVRNLPVDVAREQRAQVLIAVNVGTPLASEATLGSAVGVAQQMLNILTEQNVQRSLAELGAADILIAPQLDGVSFTNFQAAAEAIAAGERAAWQVAERLRALSVAPADYAVLEGLRTGTGRRGDDGAERRPLVALDIAPGAGVSAAALRAQSGLVLGDAVSLEDVRLAADRLHGSGDFERVDFEVTDTPLGRRVLLRPAPAEWRRSRLRLGLQLSSDFQDDTGMVVSALHVLGGLNTWGGELRTLARIGSERRLSTEWWQPLGAGSPWFAVSQASWGSQPYNVYVDERRVARLGVSAASVSLALGRQIGSVGDLRVGLVRRYERGRALVPENVADAVLEEYATARFVQLGLDTLDPLAFPTSGRMLAARYEDEPRSRSRGTPLGNTAVLGMQAFRFGDWGGHVYGEWARGRNAGAPLSLGGFLRLSGTPRDSVGGGRVALARAVLARQVGSMPTGLGGAVRAGLSLEAGNAWRDAATGWGTARTGGSVFVSVDTRLGPLYLAAGATRRGGSALYLFLGSFW